MYSIISDMEPINEQCEAYVHHKILGSLQYHNEFLGSHQYHHQHHVIIKNYGHLDHGHIIIIYCTVWGSNGFLMVPH